MFQLSGSLNVTSSPINKISPNVEVIIATDPVSDVEKLTNEITVNDTFTNRQVFNPATVWSSVDSLYSYPESTPIQVTYFTKNNSVINTKTADTEFGNAIGITQNFIKLINFELRLDGPLTYAYDSERNVSSVSGVAFMYPGLDVSIGDVFLYNTSPDTIGLFKVTNKERLAIDKHSFHRIEFELIKFPTILDLQELSTYVDKTAYFYKDTFFNGKLGIIYDETYQLIKTLYGYHAKLINYYYTKFFDNNFQTFFRPDKVYDQNVVDFLHEIVNFHKMEKYPIHLLPDNKDKQNVFYYLLNSDSVFKSVVRIYYTTPIKMSSYRDTNMTPLIGNKYVVLSENNTDTPYVFYNYITDNITAFTSIELLMYNYTMNRTINPNDLITIVDNMINMSELDQFYNIPVYLYFISMLIGVLLR